MLPNAAGYLFESIQKIIKFFCRTFVREEIFNSNILNQTEFHTAYTHFTIANTMNTGMLKFYLVPCTTFELKNRVPPGSEYSVRTTRMGGYWEKSSHCVLLTILSPGCSCFEICQKSTRSLPQEAANSSILHLKAYLFLIYSFPATFSYWNDWYFQLGTNLCA